MAPDLCCVVCSTTLCDAPPSIVEPCRRHAPRPGNTFAYNLSGFFAEHRVPSGVPHIPVTVLATRVLRVFTSGYERHITLMRVRVRVEPGSEVATFMARLRAADRRFYSCFSTPQAGAPPSPPSSPSVSQEEKEASWTNHGDGTFTLITQYDGMRIQHREFSDEERTKFIIGIHGHPERRLT